MRHVNEPLRFIRCAKLWYLTTHHVVLRSSVQYAFTQVTRMNLYAEPPKLDLEKAKKKRAKILFIRFSNLGRSPHAHPRRDSLLDAWDTLGVQLPNRTGFNR